MRPNPARRLAVAISLTLGTTLTANAQATWVEQSSGDMTMPGGELWHQFYFDEGRGAVVVHNANQFGTTLLEFDGVAWSEIPTPSDPATVVGSRIAYDPDRQVLVRYGGSDRFSGFASTATWEFDGTDWAQRSTSGPLFPLRPMVYDATTQRVVVWTADATWEYDGVAGTWTEIPAGPQHPDDAGMSAVFDAAIGKIVAFGGSTGVPNPASNETWIYDGLTQAWSLASPAVSPPGRSLAHAAYDPGLGRMVVQGGEGEFLSSPSLQDTWSYDAAANTWIPMDVAGPQGRLGTMVYDPVDETLRLFARFGEPPALELRDHWTLDVLGATSVDVQCAPANPHYAGGPVTLADSAFGGSATGLHLDAKDGPPGEFGFFVVSAGGSSSIPVFGGVLCLDAPMGRYDPQVAGNQGLPQLSSVGQFDGNGDFVNLAGSSVTGFGFDVPFALPYTPPGQTILPGDTYYFQCWYRDQSAPLPNPGSSANLSDMIRATFP